MINYNITAVLAANRNLPLLESFYEMFHRDFPEIPIVISMLQAPEGFKEWASNIEDPNTIILQGSPKDGHNVSFSELYNAGINAVQTKNLVLIHDDMIEIPKVFVILEVLLILLILKDLEIVVGD